MIRRYPPIIALTGKAGAGKDTVADYLVEKHGYTRYAFADPMKEMLNSRFGWKMEQWGDRIWKERPCVTVGNPAAEDLRHLSPRQLAQWLGTEVGRAIFHDAWVYMFERWYYTMCDLAERNDSNLRVVISDCRFDNEAIAIQRLKGIVLQIERPGIQSVNEHTSENGVDWRYVWGTVYNLSTKEKLYNNVEGMLHGY